jgi:transposase-like protein
MSGNGKRGAARRSEGEWRTLLAGYDAGGVSVGAFCEQAGISEANFYRWRSRFKSGRTGSSPPVRHQGRTFIDAGALEAGSSRRARVDLKLDLGDGWVLQLVRS